MSNKKNTSVYTMLSVLFLFIIIMSFLLFFYYAEPRNSYFPLNPHFDLVDFHEFGMMHPHVYNLLEIHYTFLYSFFLGLYVLSILAQMKVFNKYSKLFFLGTSLIFLSKTIYTLSVDFPEWYIPDPFEMFMEVCIVVVFLISFLIYEKKDDSSGLTGKIKGFLPILSILLIALLGYLCVNRYNYARCTNIVSRKINQAVEEKTNLIKVGMKKNDIIKIMGKPYEMFEQQQPFSWIYVIEIFPSGDFMSIKKMEVIFGGEVCEKIQIIFPRPAGIPNVVM